MRNICIIGIGNILMCDDGTGIHAVMKLREMDLPQGVEVFDAGCDAFYALQVMWGRSKAIILDACRGNNAPGTLYRFTFQQLHMDGEHTFRLSIHDLNFIDVLKAAKEVYRLPDEIIFIGVEPAVVGWGAELSPCVTAALPALIERVLREL